MNEWALLIMTVCVPAAVGGFLFLGLFHKQLAGNDGFKVMKLSLIVLAAVSIVGLFAAFFHLGTPSHAFYTILGFGRSWMSNEIVFTGAFIALACITAGLAMVQKRINPTLILLTAVVGLIDVYCMASIYAVTRVNGWGNINTYLVFYGTVFTLGPVLAASLLGATVESEPVTKILKWAFALAVFGISIQIIGTVIFSVSPTDVQLINGTTATEHLTGYSSMITSRWILEIIGLAVLGFVSMSSKKSAFTIVYLALVVLLIGEAMSRYVFYVLGA
ncbi:DmsC/YnfH family molybdoenzyme membrane anchor subunit [Neobacillus sp. OS1-32]|jgi:anaerobic dimethyl sulfoxide reductase subunit C (anchor subunit)|uniref:Dimethyl sulfoxide reductase anchor subunit n=1 Tax=Neobacillus paridis TaxID=2803862 RepID=A0ABS1TUC9_9BACI|nr:MULTISPECIES: DmsC/YnfH family molybdoenzyme membrane anchor subunit [Neobacillus]MBL4953505.1 dimethyl sulfoxide reductase anchor subunit [Neobacillus paridis]WML29176.1 DmsC/YnfH family molybdoenzyme membrane anchor subunit [Neobacillus sp. OS1-32]